MARAKSKALGVCKEALIALGALAAGVVSVPIIIIVLLVLAYFGPTVVKNATAPTYSSISRFTKRNLDLLNRAAEDIDSLGDDVGNIYVLKYSEDYIVRMHPERWSHLRYGDLYFTRYVDDEPVYTRVESPAIKRLFRTIRIDDAIRFDRDGHFEFDCGEKYIWGEYSMDYSLLYVPEGKAWFDRKVRQAPNDYVPYENGWRYQWPSEGGRCIMPVTGNWFYVEEIWPP